MKKFLKWLKEFVKKILKESVDPVDQVDPVDPVDQVDPNAPIKIPHGAEVSLATPEGGDCNVNVGGLQFRIFDIKSDKAICKAAMAAKAIVVKDGKAVAHDFKNSAGQIMVWQYWTLGTSSLSAKSTENPVVAKNDTRVWYRCYSA